MNEQLETYARTTLKEGLAKFPKENQIIFKKMYSHKNLDLPINDVVDLMKTETLDWAMQQVQRTLDRLR